MTRRSEPIDPSIEITTEGTSNFETPGRQLEKNRVILRLFEIILNMPEKDQRNLMVELEVRHPHKRQKFMAERRKFSRKSSLIAIDCVTNNKHFTDFIQNISNGGVFIQTGFSFYVGQELTMNFSLPNVEDIINISGEVVRLDSQGIGVKFIRKK